MTSEEVLLVSFKSLSAIGQEVLPDFAEFLKSKEKTGSG
jgi:hypothetical protein